MHSATEVADIAMNQPPNGNEANPDQDFGDTTVKPEQLARATRLRTVVRGAGQAKAVAARAGIPFGTLNHYLMGREMKAGAMVALAEATGVRLEWLATGRGPIKTTDFPDAEHHLDTGAADQPWVAAARPALDRLRQAINDAGGPAAVAERSGVSIDTVARYLRSPELLSPDLLAIADACKVTLEWVLADRAITLPEAPAGVSMDFDIIAKYVEISYDLTKRTSQDWTMERRLRWAWDRYLRDLKPE